MSPQENNITLQRKDMVCTHDTTRDSRQISSVGLQCHRQRRGSTNHISSTVTRRNALG